MIPLLTLISIFPGAWNTVLHLTMEHEILSFISFSHLQCALKSKGYLNLKDTFDAHLPHRYQYPMAMSQFCNSFLFASMQINFAQLRSQSIEGIKTEALKKPAQSSCYCWEQGGEAEVGSVTLGRQHPYLQLRHCNPHPLFSSLYLHSILHLHGARLCVL